jgi:hypothetical protein
MELGLSFVAAWVLATADLGLLALATRRLGARPAAPQVVLLALGLMLKLALLFVGCHWIAAQAWYDRRGLLAGLVAPFLLFIAWQALRLQVGAKKSAKD